MALLPENAGAAILIGDGPERPHLEKLVEELQLTPRIFFAGKKSHAEIAEWMSAVDALVIPSRNEGWPTVIFEALACGLQVVGAAVGGIPEALNSDEVGILVPPEDPAALAAALSKVAQRKPDKNKLRARAERFSWERLSKQVLQVYQSVLGEADGELSAR
jgi:glycosyltransferase involved in cell wall biosynthesis